MHHVIVRCRSSLRRLLALTAALVIAAIATQSAVASITAATDEVGTNALAPGVTEVAVFSDPYIDQTNWDDYAIHDRIRGMIRSTPAGQSIHVALFAIGTVAVTDDLLAAKARGVNVYVAHSAHDTGTQAERLRVGLGTRYVRCRGSSAGVEACISNRDSSLMHTKFFLFSQTVDAGITKSNVVAVTSANMTDSQSKHYNNLVVIGGDAIIYNGYKAVFDDMFNLRKNNNYYASPNGYLTSDNSDTTSYFSPRADSAGGTAEEASTDTVARTLTYLYGGTGCYVKTAQANITSTRDAIINELLRIRRLGCTVQVAYTDIDAGVKSTLKAAGVQLRQVKTTHSNSTAVTAIHHKYYIVYGNYSDDTNTYRVFTGSHNWTGSTLRLNDEVILKLYDQTIINGFNSDFTKIWNRGVAQ